MNDIKKELNEREDKCNNKVVYEYKRPKNPYKYSKLNDFKKENPFDSDKNCGIIVPNSIYDTDRNNRYYKSIHTSKRCKNANGKWDERTINRENLIDDGNCWVDEEDFQCANLLTNNKLLNSNLKDDDKEVIKAAEVCNRNDKCNLGRINENTIDCVVKNKINVKEIDKIYNYLDFSNIEESLFNYYSSLNAPKTQKLIGKGDRCNNDKDIQDKIDEKINEEKKLEKIIKDEEILIAKDLIKMYEPYFIAYLQYRIIFLASNIYYFNNNGKKELKKLLNDNYDNFFLDYNILKANFRNYYYYSYYPNNKVNKEVYVYQLFYKYFPTIFFENNDEAYDRITYLFTQSFIKDFNPLNDDEINKINIMIFQKKLLDKYDDFKYDYRTVDKMNLDVIYYNYFPNYFMIDIDNKEINNEINYYKYTKYFIIYYSFIKKTNKKNKLSFYIDDIDKYDDFIQELAKSKNKINVFKKYFSNYFFDDYSIDTIYFIRNQINYLDPNNIDDYELLKNYVDTSKSLNDYRKYYNLIENKSFNEDDEDRDIELLNLRKLFFPNFFNNINETKYKIKPLSDFNDDENGLNNNLPTIPQSVVNNISKLISENKIDKRGMLLWHSTGSGKTCTATAIMDGFWNDTKDIIYCSSVDALISNPPYKFHECASNLFPRFRNKSIRDVEKLFNSRNIKFLSFAKLANRIEKKEINLNDCILIIDEVHNLFRPLLTQKKQHNYLEKLLLNQKLIPNTKIFILTATLGDNPNEIMKLLNIIKKANDEEIKFDDIQKPDLFKNKIRGLISYFDMSSDSSKFPVVYDKEPIYSKMSDKQFEKYLEQYKTVKDSAKNYEALAKANTLNKYWAIARKYSNMLFNYDKGLKLNEFSSKLETLLKSLTNDEYEKHKHYVYSAFYENRGYGGQGILAIAKELDKLGYEKLTPSQAVEILNNPTEDNKKPRYLLAITTQLGSDKGSDLKKLMELFNAPFNKYGEYVKLFLASQTFNEGIDLKAVRHIHIFEPLITWASDKQTLGRAARNCSHKDLDKSNWDVTIHRYMSNFPEIINNSDENRKLNQKLIELGDTDNHKNTIKELKKQLKKEKDQDEKFQLEKQIEELQEKLNEIKEINKLMKKNDKNKKDYDISGIENIDDFIYKQATEKMKNILTLYQFMQEAAVDCLILNEFHRQGNKDINCHKF